jgi:hypothetical protein
MTTSVRHNALASVLHGPRDDEGTVAYAGASTLFNIGQLERARSSLNNRPFQQFPFLRQRSCPTSPGAPASESCALGSVQK